MIWLDIPLQPQPLPFYLAAEEWAALAMPGREVFFCWQPQKDTVICGRHQQIELEVDLDYCRSHGIEVVRRRSGGGCVYSGRGNLMFSMIIPATEIAPAFSLCAHTMAAALQRLGIRAEVSGRNDIAVEGRKLSGCAYYSRNGCGIVHGTLLCSLGDPHMARAITPSQAKVESKGVTSVEARVISLADCGLKLSPAEVAERLRKVMCKGSLTLMADEIESIRRLAQTYSSPGFLWQQHSRRRHRAAKRWEGVGELMFEYDTDSLGRISEISLSGDFLSADDTLSLTETLRGIMPTASDVGRALRARYPDGTIAGIGVDILANTFPE